MRALSVLAAALAALAPAPLAAAETAAGDTIADDAWPFPEGEQMTFGVQVGRFRAGEARLSVAGRELVRGDTTRRLVMSLKGGLPFYRVDNEHTSWVSTEPFRSLRFRERLREGDYRRHRQYDIRQDLGIVTEERWSEQGEAFEPDPEVPTRPTPVAALDEVAFLYYLRTLPLAVGDRYTLDRYFEGAHNPIRFRVTGRASVRVPEGRFEVFVIKPDLQSVDLLSQEKGATLYVADAPTRPIVKMETRTPFGPLTLYLKEYRTGR